MKSEKIEQALSWAHQNGYAYAKSAIADYCAATGRRATAMWEGYVVFRDADSPAPTIGDSNTPYGKEINAAV